MSVILIYYETYPKSIVSVHEAVDEAVHHNVPLLDWLIPIVHDPPGHKRRHVMIPFLEIKKSLNSNVFWN